MTLRKEPVRPGLTARQKFIRFSIGFEVIFAAGCYYFYRKLNRNSDFRYHCYSYYPKVLEAYYKICEVVGGSKIRFDDLTTWEKEQKKLK